MQFFGLIVDYFGNETETFVEVLFGYEKETICIKHSVADMQIKGLGKGKLIFIKDTTEDEPSEIYFGPISW